MVFIGVVTLICVLDQKSTSQLMPNSISFARLLNESYILERFLNVEITLFYTSFPTTLHYQNTLSSEYKVLQLLKC